MTTNNHGIREKNIFFYHPDHLSSAALAEAIRQYGQKQIHYLPEVLADPARLLPLLEPGDLVLTLGAGSVGRLGEQLLALLQGVGP